MLPAQASQNDSAKSLPFMSIIIPTYNREDMIGNCLDSIKNVDYPKEKMEVIVVDDGSVDNTLKIISKYDIKKIKQNHAGPAVARNNGIKNSKGSIIVFTDDDCVVPKNWLKDLAKYFRDKTIVAVGGSIEPIGESLAVKYEQYRRYLLYGKLGSNVFSKGFSYLPTCNLAVRKTIIKEIGFFDKSFKHAAAEDVDFCYRIYKTGKIMFYDPRIAIKHYHKQAWMKILKRRFIHSKATLRFYDKYGFNKKLILNYGIASVYMAFLASIFINQTLSYILFALSLIPHIKNIRKISKKMELLPFVFIDYFMYFVDSFGKLVYLFLKK